MQIEQPRAQNRSMPRPGGGARAEGAHGDGAGEYRAGGRGEYRAGGARRIPRGGQGQEHTVGRPSSRSRAVCQSPRSPNRTRARPPACFGRRLRRPWQRRARPGGCRWRKGGQPPDLCATRQTPPPPPAQPEPPPHTAIATAAPATAAQTAASSPSVSRPPLPSVSRCRAPPPARPPLVPPARRAGRLPRRYRRPRPCRAPPRYLMRSSGPGGECACAAAARGRPPPEYRRGG
eukprot:scaffold29493_cov79-Isochrysis_galbana.AAC.1